MSKSKKQKIELCLDDDFGDDYSDLTTDGCFTIKGGKYWSNALQGDITATLIEGREAEEHYLEWLEWLQKFQFLFEYLEDYCENDFDNGEGCRIYLSRVVNKILNILEHYMVKFEIEWGTSSAGPVDLKCSDSEE